MKQLVSELPGDEVLRQFDDAQAARYNAELDTRLDQIDARARTLLMTKINGQEQLRQQLARLLQAKKDAHGRYSRPSLTRSHRLIERAVGDDRPSALPQTIWRATLIAIAGSLVAGVLWRPRLLIVSAGLVVLVAVALAGWFLILRRRSRAHYDAWLPGVWGLMSRDRDPATMDATQAAEALKSQWNVERQLHVQMLMGRLLLAPEGNPGWRLTQAIQVARLAHACGLIDASELAAHMGTAAQRLQDEYDGWDELAADVDEGWRAQAQARGRTDELETVADNARYLAGSVWPGVPFLQP